MSSVSPLRGASRVPPHDEQAERALLGAMLTTREAREIGLELPSEAFLLPFHAKVHQAIAQVHDESPAGVDVVTVAARLGSTTAPLLALVLSAPMSGHAGHYAQIVARHARFRAAIRYADALSEAGWRQDDTEIECLLTSADVRLAPPIEVEAATTELLELFEQPAPIPKPWVIPGLLRAGENLVLTGGEGAGKATFMRQLAIGAAAGIHPFTDQPMARSQVLIVDLQEDETELREELWKQHKHVAKHYRRGMIQTVSRRAGVDLLTAHDARWFESLLTRIRPGFVIMGPLKKLYRAPTGKGIWDDDVVEALHRRFDEWQARFGFAMCLEGHAGHDRETWRVKGSSAWYAWPHFGYGLNPVSWKPREVEMIRWRGDRENGVPRHWPSRLVESSGWAWSANKAAVDEMRAVQRAGDSVETMEAFGMEATPLDETF